MKLQRYLLSGIVGFLVLAGFSSAEAGLITSVVSSNNDVASIDPITGISDAVYNHAENGTGTGAITINLEVFQLHTPVQLTFTYAARGDSPDRTDYAITLNILNSVPDSLKGFNMNGFDITNNSTTNAAVDSASVRGAVPITSNRFGVLYSGTTNILNGFRWGGLNGGGPRLAFGDTASNTFTYRVNWASSAVGTSTLNFVANPEPATILLGSLAMVPAGIAAHRRRKNAKTAAAPAV
jgi:hypothetical protein